QTFNAQDPESITNFKYEGVEADDLIALSTIVLEPVVDHIWIISTDQDFCQLISKKISLFAYKSRKEFTVDSMFEYTNAENGEQHLFIKCLQGDAGDSVPGVPDVGPKRAYGLARQYGDLFNLAASLPVEGKQKFIQSLNNFGTDKLMLNMELMDLKSYCATAIAHPNPQNLEDALSKLEAVKEHY
ncbi:MAG: 5'-3' exonuclease H3TH domain-containing protein, partial [Phocaeicola sp.]